MSIPTGIESQRNLPRELIELVRSTAEAHIATLVDDGFYAPVKIRHYAGEFLAEDNMERLISNVKQHPHILYDLDTIDEIDTNSDQKIPNENFAFLLYICTSNFFDESLQWSESYALAWDVRNGFRGVEFSATPEIASNGFFLPGSIERELHVPGMSVHTLRLDIELIYDIDGE